MSRNQRQTPVVRRKCAPRPAYRYVSEVKAANPKLTCAICLEPFIHPFKTPCRHTFCEECIFTAIQDRRSCPTCRGHVVEHQLVPADDTLQELLDDLQVYCAHSSQGCTWKGPRGNYEEHVERTCRRGEIERIRQLVNPSAQDVVKLNVGGRRFDTTRATLTKRSPNSHLAALFAHPERLHRNAAGEVILELDPQAFDFILAWLRIGVVPRGLDMDLQARLDATARFLCLDEMVLAKANRNSNYATTADSNDEEDDEEADEEDNNFDDDDSESPIIRHYNHPVPVRFYGDNATAVTRVTCRRSNCTQSFELIYWSTTNKFGPFRCPSCGTKVSIPSRLLRGRDAIRAGDIWED